MPSRRWGAGGCPSCRLIPRRWTRWIANSSSRPVSTSSVPPTSASRTFALATPTAADLLDLARRGWSADADILVITCLNTHSERVAATIEAEIGKPVVTSTTATLWHMLRLADCKDNIPGFGRLLGLA
ncbi:hypothetical protein ABLE93_21305 [Xanthobacter sp. KR7-65]|uniref:aspartate racemase/maleate isomerase family protein n=1 Tax=Xanthobacter sp. KR7-65 TaxID=3156612 RepID=UPI0032B4A399